MMMPTGGGELSKQGAFSDTAIIPGLGTYQTIVDLGGANWNKGYVVLQNGASGALPSTAGYYGKTAFIMFERDTAAAFSQSGTRIAQALSSYIFYEWRQVGFSRSLDGRLSNSDWGFAGRLRIMECHISGSNLVIEWRNFINVVEGFVVEGKYHVFE